MGSLVADTHAFLWYLQDSPRLSQRARSALIEAIETSALVRIASVSLVEMRYLVEKGRIAPLQFAQAMEVVRSERSPFQIVPLKLEVAEALARVSVRQVPDMPDRIICATARHLGLPLVSRDRKILAADIETIW